MRNCKKKQLTVQFHVEIPFFGLRLQIDHLKPERQQQFADLENGAGDSRSRPLALVALLQFEGIALATLRCRTV